MLMDFLDLRKTLHFSIKYFIYYSYLILIKMTRNFKVGDILKLRQQQKFFEYDKRTLVA